MPPITFLTNKTTWRYAISIVALTSYIVSSLCDTFRMVECNEIKYIATAKATSRSATHSVASGRLPITSESHSTTAIERKINAIRTAQRKIINDTTTRL